MEKTLAKRAYPHERRRSITGCSSDRYTSTRRVDASQRREDCGRGSGKVSSILIDCSRRESREAHRSRVGTEDRVNVFLFT